MLNILKINNLQIFGVRKHIVMLFGFLFVGFWGYGQLQSGWTRTFKRNGNTVRVENVSDDISVYFHKDHPSRNANRYPFELSGYFGGANELVEYTKGPATQNGYIYFEISADDGYQIYKSSSPTPLYDFPNWANQNGRCRKILLEVKVGEILRIVHNNRSNRIYPYAFFLTNFKNLGEDLLLLKPEITNVSPNSCNPTITGFFPKHLTSPQQHKAGGYLAQESCVDDFTDTFHWRITRVSGRNSCQDTQNTTHTFDATVDTNGNAISDLNSLIDKICITALWEGEFNVQLERRITIKGVTKTLLSSVKKISNWVDTARYNRQENWMCFENTTIPVDVGSGYRGYWGTPPYTFVLYKKKEGSTVPPSEVTFTTQGTNDFITIKHLPNEEGTFEYSVKQITDSKGCFNRIDLDKRNRPRVTSVVRVNVVKPTFNSKPLEYCIPPIKNASFDEKVKISESYVDISPSDFNITLSPNCGSISWEIKNLNGVSIATSAQTTPIRFENSGNTEITYKIIYKAGSQTKEENITIKPRPLLTINN